MGKWNPEREVIYGKNQILKRIRREGREDCYQRQSRYLTFRGAHITFLPSQSCLLSLMFCSHGGWGGVSAGTVGLSSLRADPVGDAHTDTADAHPSSAWNTASMAWMDGWMYIWIDEEVNE